MALIRYAPVRELGTIQTEMNRLFNSFFDTPTTASGIAGRRWVPAMDLVENEGEYVLSADLPGLSESEVNIEVQDSVLTISGERKSEHEERKAGYRRVERSSGSFRRSLALPKGVDPESVSATFDKGVLKVTVPKPAQPVARKVQISAEGEPQAIESSESTEHSDSAAA